MYARGSHICDRPQAVADRPHAHLLEHIHEQQGRLEYSSNRSPANSNLMHKARAHNRLFKFSLTQRKVAGKLAHAACICGTHEHARPFTKSKKTHAAIQSSLAIFFYLNRTGATSQRPDQTTRKQQRGRPVAWWGGDGAPLSLVERATGPRA